MKNSIVQQDDRICYLCKKPIYTDRDCHHIFNGAYRNKSEEDKLYVYLHHTCHMWLHEHPMSMNTFKKRGQRIYEEKLGDRKSFMARYGKNYLLED